MLVLTLFVLIRVGCALAGVAGGGAVAGGCGGCLHAGQAVEGGWSRLETSRAFPCTTPSAKYTKKIDNKQIRTFFISLWAKYGQGQWKLGLNKDIGNNVKDLP